MCRTLIKFNKKRAARHNAMAMDSTKGGGLGLGFRSGQFEGSLVVTGGTGVSLAARQPQARRAPSISICRAGRIL